MQRSTNIARRSFRRSAPQNAAHINRSPARCFSAHSEQPGTRHFSAPAAQRKVYDQNYLYMLDQMESLKEARAQTSALPLVTVTGATGYLAMELVGQLLEHKKYRVRGTVRSLSDADKIAPLTRLEGAAERLELVEADLLEEGSFDTAVEGAKYVFHTASPFITSGVEDPQTQLVDPAVKGTENVMRSAVAHSVQRVVLTSSVAAVMGGLGDKDCAFDESDWNTSSTIDSDCGLDLYRLSKKLAEEAAWGIAKESGMELAAINPSFLIGPPRMARATGESVANMKALLEGKIPPRDDTPMADTRDVAAAHILAAETPEAAGHRFIISSPSVVRRASVVRTIADDQPGLDIVDLGEPAPLCDRTREVFKSKTTGTVIPLQLRTPQESLRDMATAMIDLGAASPRPKTNLDKIINMNLASCSALP